MVYTVILVSSYQTEQEADDLLNVLFDLMLDRHHEGKLDTHILEKKEI